MSLADFYTYLPIVGDRRYSKDLANLAPDPYNQAALISGSTANLGLLLGTGVSATLTPSVPGAPFATPGLLRTGTQTGIFGRNFSLTQAGIAVGETVIIGFAVWQPQGRRVTAQIIFRDASNGVVAGAPADVNSTTGPGLFINFTSATVPAGAVSVDVRFSPITTGAGPETILGFFVGKQPASATAVPLASAQAIFLAGLIPTEQRRLLIPSTVYSLLGSTSPIEEANIYLDCATQLCPGDTVEPVGVGIQYDAIPIPSTGWSSPAVWRVQPGNTASSQNPTAAGNNTVTFRIFNRGRQIVRSVATTLTVASPTNTATQNVLAFWDSYNMRNDITAQVKALLGGTINLVGTRTFSTDGTSGTGTGAGTNYGEGRGGWLAPDYTDLTSKVGTSGSTAMDSPLAFPSGIAGNKYFGNTEFWKRVKSTPTNYEQIGFQAAEKNFNLAGTSVYGSDGYPASPTAGDVVYDPLQSAGSRFRTYSGSAWAASSPQPTWELSFTKYMQKWATALTSPPDFVLWGLGMNDAWGPTTLESSSSGANFITATDAFIATVRAYSPMIKIVICTPAIVPKEIDGGRHTENLKELVERILFTYNTAAMLANGVYVIDTHNAVDPYWSWDRPLTNANKFESTQTIRISDVVHCNANGKKQIGDRIGAFIQSFRPANTETAAWAASVGATGGILTSAQISAYDAFVTGMKADGNYSALGMVNALIGDGLAAISVPQKVGAGSATHALTNFTGGNFAGASGLTGDGTTKYINTGETPSVSTGGIFVYVRTATTSGVNSMLMGCRDATSTEIYRLGQVGTGYAGTWGKGTGATVPTAVMSPGLYHIVRTGSTTITLYRNGVSVATDSTSITPAGPGYPLFVFAQNSGGSPGIYYGGSIGCYGTTASMNGTQAAALYARIQTLMTALGRNV